MDIKDMKDNFRADMAIKMVIDMGKRIQEPACKEMFMKYLEELPKEELKRFKKIVDIMLDMFRECE